LSRIALGLASILALVVAAPAVAGPNVANISGGATVAQVDWAYDDGDTFVGGYLVAAEETRADPVVEYFLYTETIVQCAGAETAEDPTDDVWDFYSVVESGFGPAATFAIGKSYSSATATAVLTIAIDAFDGCVGEVTSTIREDVPVRLEVVGTSPLIRESGHGSFHIPSDINAHGSFKQTYRLGTGVAQIADRTIAGDGVLGELSWRDHSNGR
jgi:hypothetical protein